MNIMSSLPQALRRLRKERGLKQSEIAAATGREVQTVSNWETGRTDVPASALGAYLDCLGCGLGDLDRALKGLNRADLEMPRLRGRGPVAPGDVEAPEQPLTEEQQGRLAIEIQLVATRAVKLLLAARDWSPAEAARHCGWEDAYRIIHSLERQSGWTLEKLAILSTAAGLNVADLVTLAYDSLDAERQEGRREVQNRQDTEEIVAMIEALPVEERQRILAELKGKLSA